MAKATHLSQHWSATRLPQEQLVLRGRGRDPGQRGEVDRAEAFAQGIWVQSADSPQDVQRRYSTANTCQQRLPRSEAQP